MNSVAEVQGILLSQAAKLESVPMPLAEAAGLVLREDARADRDSPPFDASAMDGFACRRGDLSGSVAIIGESLPGKPFSGTVGLGQCVMVLTGALVPAGSDCVVKQEDTVREGTSIRVTRPDSRSFIRQQGENRRTGEVVVPAGTVLTAPELAALAGVGIASPQVTRAARCVHFALGDELVAPDANPGPGSIRDTNSVLISTLLAAQHASLVAQTRAGDDGPEIARRTAGLPDHDLLLISGGAGPGSRDPARPLLQALGYTIRFDGVNLRPGKPLIYATRGQQHALAIPGNPVSHWVIFQLFVAPLIRALQGHTQPRPIPIRGTVALADPLPPPDPRPTYWPCRATTAEGSPQLSLLSIASSGDASGLVGANALLPLPVAPASLQRGQSVDFFPCP